MSQWIAMCIVLCLFAIGDIAGVVSRAKVSSVFVTLLCFMVLFISGILPKDIMNISGLSAAAKISGQLVVFSMGTNINFRQLANEWRSVAVAVISMFVALICVLLVSPLIGRDSALVAIPVVNGGVIATQIMVEAATAKGAVMAAALGTLCYGVQKFFGTLPASLGGLKEAEKIVAELRRKKQIDPNYSWYEENNADSLIGSSGGKLPFWKRHEKIWTPYVTLFCAALATLISIKLAELTDGWIGASIWALVLGACSSELGLVPPKILDRGKSSGLLIILIFVSIISSLAAISLEDLISLSFSIIVIFVSILIGLYFVISVLPIWKIVGSKHLALGISMCQMLGYPATYLVSQEIAKAVGETEEEMDAISARIEPAYVVAGFATVTTFSVIMAEVIAKIL